MCPLKDRGGCRPRRTQRRDSPGRSRPTQRRRSRERAQRNDDTSLSGLSTCHVGYLHSPAGRMNALLVQRVRRRQRSDVNLRALSRDGLGLEAFQTSVSPLRLSLRERLIHKMPVYSVGTCGKKARNCAETSTKIHPRLGCGTAAWYCLRHCTIQEDVLGATA